jgi:hypothetical protein
MKKYMMAMAALAVLATVAAAAPVDTPERDGRYVAVEAGAAIDQGAMVCMYTDAEAYEAADVANYAVIGRAENSAAEGETVLVKRGVFRWANLGAFTDKDIGLECYVSNSVGVTTAALASLEIRAGVITDVDANGVWVDTYNRSVLLTSTVSALTITGNATVGGTLGITGVTTFTAAPKVTAVTTPTAITATATNAPALAAAASPKWVTVTIGSDTCVMPAYKLQ